MLRLRPRQFNQLGQAHFVDRAVEFLRRNREDFAAMDSAMGREFVEQTMRVATGTYGLASQRGVMTFVLATWYLGPDFAASHPAADEILRSRDLSEAERTSRLYRWTWKQLGEEPS